MTMGLREQNATVEEMAALEFEPMGFDLAGTHAATDLDWNEFMKWAACHIRIASRLVNKSKSELVETLGGLEPEIAMEMVEKLVNCSNQLRGFSDLLGSAYARSLSALANNQL